MFLKVIACEIALREICFAAARTPNIVDLEFLPQGLHDTPARGRDELQQCLDRVPAGKYDAVLVGYGLCGSILKDLRAGSTRLVVPRAHDCITFFLGSRDRYQAAFTERPGTYYFTSGWLECRRRRAAEAQGGHRLFMPAQSFANFQAQYEQWVARYGEEQANYLRDEMRRWTDHYTHGVLIEFDFTRSLGLGKAVQEICREKGWTYQEVPGDLSLLQRWLDGDWASADFLTVPPGSKIIPSFNDGIIDAVPA